MARGDVRKIIDLFKFFYLNITKVSDYRMIVNDSLETKIVDFCDRIRTHTNSNSIQEDYLNQYFEFQFNRHYKKRGVRGGRLKGGGIKLSWIICDKSFKEWENSEEFKRLTSWIVRKNLKTDISFKEKKKHVKFSEKDLIFLRVNLSEELEKSYLNGKPEQLTSCEKFTFMYFHESKICSVCGFKEECKDKLREKYPKIYKIRGYED